MSRRRYTVCGRILGGKRDLWCGPGRNGLWTGWSLGGVSCTIWTGLDDLNQLPRIGESSSNGKTKKDTVVKKETTGVIEGQELPRRQSEIGSQKDDERYYIRLYYQNC